MDADYDVRVPNDYNEFKELIRKRREAVRQAALVRETEDNLRKIGGYPGQDDDDYGSGSEEEEEADAYHRSKLGRFAPPATYNQTNQASSFQTPAISAFEDDDEKPYLSPPPIHTPLPVPADAISASGEEAYQRRLAMSQIHPPLMREAILNDHIKAEDMPGSQSMPDLAARAAAAAAIAARLAKAAPNQTIESTKRPSAPAFVASTMHGHQQDAASFAERLMTKQGWKKGDALGAEGNKGMLDPILAEKVEIERRKQHMDTSRQSSHSNRGTIVSSQEEGRRREEAMKFGVPSEVILLENMVDLADVDDELSDEIGEECAKHGYVQRVFVWPHGRGGVRIFVKFSGMAGAWRCVKELEGRFFGGKTVRARYYPLRDFEQGNYSIVFE
ncbi:hypothetical protein CBS101457_006590 [Exobasidium rhododendri]|nr:hypothetical protein CBS101457_006590 [Exobasidium rhododendri]